MNIFVLDDKPIKAAKLHCNKHVVKMILESAQIMSTVHYLLDGETPLYKPTHKGHPAVKWASETSGNYAWLYRLFRALSQEYTRRYGKEHLTWTKGNKVLKALPKNIIRDTRTPFVQVFDEVYRSEDPVEGYRNYYCHEKYDIAYYPEGEWPEWLVKPQ